jgi:hypothetical protein
VGCRENGNQTWVLIKTREDHRPLTTEVIIRLYASSFVICGGESGTGDNILSEYFGFLLALSLHQCPVFIHPTPHYITLVID